MNTNSPGSLWRKWDLHIHTPATALNNQFEGAADEDKWERYLSEVERIDDIAVLGVTDYFSVKGYNRLLEEKDSGRLANVEYLIPNVELRIMPVTDKNHPINLHILFDPDVVPFLETAFFQELVFPYKGDRYRCTETDLIGLGKAFTNDHHLNNDRAYREGIEQFKATHHSVADALRNNERFSGRYLVGVSNNSSDGNSGIQHSSLAATRQETYRLSDFIFSGNPKDRAYFLGYGTDGRDVIELNYGSIKPCYHGSDAHSLDEVCRPEKDRFTWIKADLTFEGLKQTIYEPDARVRIQSTDPGLDYPKHYFSVIRLGGKPYPDELLEFTKTEIPLNRDLVTIVGGRGTGKSMLLDGLYFTFAKNDREGFNPPDYRVVLKKGGTDEETEFHFSEEAEYYDYLHVRQGDVKKVVDQAERLHQEVHRLLGQPRYQPDPLFEEAIAARNDRITELRDSLLHEEEDGSFTSALAHHEKQIRQNRQLLETLTTEETRKQIQEFTENTSRTSGNETLTDDLRRLEAEIKGFDTKTNEAIDSVNERLSAQTDLSIPRVDFSAQLSRVAESLSFIEARNQELAERNTVIQEDLSSKGFKGDISSLLSKADIYQRAIQQNESAMQKIKVAETELADLIAERRKSAESIRERLEAERADIDTRYENKQAGADQLSEDHQRLLHELLKDIEIRGEIVFDKNKFIAGLWDFIDGRKFRTTMTRSKEERLGETLGVDSLDDFFNLIAGKSMIQIDTGSEAMDLDGFLQMNELFYQNGPRSLVDYLYLREKRSGYLRVVPAVRYQGKELHRISVGQRGTFYLCLKLATESFSTPFVFDQPEDDLDNQFIIDQLLPIFREIKQYRQVIIATHNANLVVNADSDQVIVAHNEGEHLSYTSGALEDVDIRRTVCDVLEGGEKAFRDRERRYGI